jgi:predicted nucleic acid-binding protein
MQTSASDAGVLVDTSVAVAIVLEDHEDHRRALDAVGTRRVGLSGHAAFETYSVLTRLPPPARRSPEAVLRLMSSNFPASRYLSAAEADALLAKLHTAGVAGGSVYDALVGAAAVENGLPLLTRDHRALPVYRALDVRVEMLAP